MSDTPKPPPDKPAKPVRPRGRGNHRSGPRFDLAEKNRTDRRAEVFGMRVAGMLFKDIAAKLNLSIGQTHDDFEKARAEYSLESIEALRAVFNARMDQNHARLNANIAKLNDIISRHAEIVANSKDGCVASARIVVEASACKAGLMAEQRQTAIAVMKMNGAEAAMKVNVTGAVTGGVVVQVSTDIAKAFESPALLAESVTPAAGPGPSDNTH